MLVLCNKLFIKKPLSHFGLQAPKKNLSIMLICFFLALLMPYIYFFSQQKSFQLSYSWQHISLFNFLTINFLLMSVYYFAEEFFFRGFLFLSLWEKVRWHSFWITDIIFTLSHLGKPGLEVIFCIPVSIILNGVTLATRSIYPALIIHYSLGVFLNVLVNYVQGPLL